MSAMHARAASSLTSYANGPRCSSSPATSRPPLWRLPRATKEESDALLEAGIADLARQTLQSDPEAAAQLKRYEAAVVSLEKVKARDKELEQMMRDAAKQAAADDAAEAQQMRAKQDQVLADADVVAAEKLLKVAEIKYNQAQQQLNAAGQDEERIESGKAAAIAAVAGAAATLPLLAGSSQPSAAAVLSLAASVGACFLFGVTYRYAVRQDASNTQLKAGVLAAFALVKSIGAGDVLQASAGGNLDVQLLGTAGLYAAQSMLTFAFAATALEAAFGAGLLRRCGQQQR